MPTQTVGSWSLPHRYACRIEKHIAELIKNTRAKRALDIPANGEGLLPAILCLDPARRASAAETLQVMKRRTCRGGASASPSSLIVLLQSV